MCTVTTAADHHWHVMIQSTRSNKPFNAVLMHMSILTSACKILKNVASGLHETVEDEAGAHRQTAAALL